MQIVIEDDILEYCFHPEERVANLDQAEASAARPAFVLPIFEACRAIHFAARENQLIPGQFRGCWADLVAKQWERSTNGSLFHLSQAEAEGDNLPRDILELGVVALQTEDPDDDPRGIPGQHRALTARFRVYHQQAVRYLAMLDPGHRGWSCEALDELPEQRFPERPDQSLVLDTNIFIELLNALPESDQWTGTLRLPDRVRAVEGCERRLRAILNSNGLEGKLIVPVSVLEEAERVASYDSHQHSYRQARQTLRDMSLRPDRIPWIAFSFERLSIDLLGAFLHLHEELYARQLPREQWPDFGDALVLAHGLLNGCPVLSMEWVEKKDWATVGGIFERLVFK
jgi:hypothetical protein